MRIIFSNFTNKQNINLRPKAVLFSYHLKRKDDRQIQHSTSVEIKKRCWEELRSALLQTSKFAYHVLYKKTKKKFKTYVALTLLKCV